VLFVSGETRASVLEGFIITGGLPLIGTTGGGGGVKIQASSPSIRNCTIVGNRNNDQGGFGPGGGGVLVISGSPLIEGCTISSNNTGFTSSHGGGILVQSGSVEIIGCTITSNKGERGGAGIAVTGGAVTITRCAINANMTGGIADGGGVLAL
jgi:hypothetical protein